MTTEGQKKIIKLPEKYRNMEMDEQEAARLQAQLDAGELINPVEIFKTDDAMMMAHLLKQLIEALHFPPGTSGDEKMAHATRLLQTVSEVPRDSGLDEAQLVQLLAMHNAIMNAWTYAVRAPTVDVSLKYTGMAARLMSQYDKILSSMRQRDGKVSGEKTINHNHRHEISLVQPVSDDRRGAPSFPQLSDQSDAALILNEGDVQVGLSAKVTAGPTPRPGPEG